MLISRFGSLLLMMAMMVCAVSTSRGQSAASMPYATMPRDDVFVPMFNGKDLAGWVNVNTGPKTWQVKDGMIVCSGKPTGLLRTERTYENFIMELEWKHLDPHGNAGLFVWSDAIPVCGQPFTRAVEVQVMIGSEGDWYTSDGDIFPIHGAQMTPLNPRKTGGSRAFPTEKRMKPAGEWNHYRVECNNGEITLAVNGKVVTQGKNASPRKGYICLESEGTEIHFRNLKISELPTHGAEMESAETRVEMSTAFVPLMNFVDFTGWKHGPGHEGHWTVQEGVIKFDGRGEDLWTEKSYGDFVLIADWRWTQKPEDRELSVIMANGEQAVGDDGKPRTQRVPDAGDSGIYVRGSSKSQINIWCWPIGSGEVYGYRTDMTMEPVIRAGVTPKVNADRKIGEWNRFVITMKGERLTVVLNGRTVIENARLPGVAAQGPIALQMHNAPIEFGNMYIQELK